MNSLYMPFFREGREEAEAIKNGDYGLIERSTSEKAHLISILLTRLTNGSLRTQNSVGAVEFAHQHLDAVALILALADRFRYVERALLRRHNNRSTLTVEDEYDAQDLFRALLVQFFDDVRPEDWAPQFGGGASRIDFVIPDFELAIELKYTREGLTDRKLGEELIVDRDKYAAKGGVSHLICLVFDYDGRLANPRGIESDLTRDVSNEHIAVTVKILDR
ncbi:hypothetical protein [Umezawaea beigongshangensis]|uniref:PD-(D/E)XK nuclease domain-containing protein n=1 Tax=Umezawaea beigongshangensis TaxID=2780383 RepID=UPI0018F1609A|nr:hypothetical protein [Umezawaea beigongshangensis]